MNERTRLDFLDTLRVFIILLVIGLHTALAYASPHFANWAYNPQGSANFWIINFVIESGVLMPIMFFISGYFILPSAAKRSPWQFMKGKLIRLGLPFALVSLVLYLGVVGRTAGEPAAVYGKLLINSFCLRRGAVGPDGVAGPLPEAAARRAVVPGPGREPELQRLRGASQHRVWGRLPDAGRGPAAVP